MSNEGASNPPDLLRAYWRMDYVSAPQTAGTGRRNPFAELPEQDDREAYIVHRGKTCYLVLNRYPYNPGHLMVIPYREVASLGELTAGERTEVMELIVLAQEALAKAMAPDGFNVGFNFGKSAGAGIPQHLHGHIVPRWDGDTNFLPVIGGTRTLPQALGQTWERLREALSGQ